MNHLTASGSAAANTTFMLIELLDMSAAPLLAVAVVKAAPRLPHLTGALLALTTACALGLWWFLDFYGVFEDAGSSDRFERLALEVKMQVRTLTQGRAFELIAISQAIQVVGTAACCIAYPMLRALDPRTSA